MSKKELTKKEFTQRIAENAGIPLKTATTFVNVFLDTLEDAIKNDGGVSFVGFGNFKKEWKKESTARNPRTGEVVPTPGKYVLKFKVGKSLKNTLAELPKSE